MYSYKYTNRIGKCANCYSRLHWGVGILVMIFNWRFKSFFANQIKMDTVVTIVTKYDKIGYYSVQNETKLKMKEEIYYEKLT